MKIALIACTASLFILGSALLYAVEKLSLPKNVY